MRKKGERKRQSCNGLFSKKLSQRPHFLVVVILKMNDRTQSRTTNIWTHTLGSFTEAVSVTWLPTIPTGTTFVQYTVIGNRQSAIGTFQHFPLLSSHNHGGDALLSFCFLFGVSGTRPQFVFVFCSETNQCCRDHHPPSHRCPNLFHGHHQCRWHFHQHEHSNLRHSR